MGYSTDLTDEQWTWMEPILPPQEGPGRPRTVSLRRVIDALMYQDRSGCQWRLLPHVTYGWADQSYRGDLLESATRLNGITIAIVSRPADQVGFQVLPRRWVVERTIAWINRCRRLSKDFEHHAKNSAAWIYWASIQRMLRSLAPPCDQEPPYARKSAALAT